MEIFIPPLEKIGLLKYHDGDLHIDCNCSMIPQNYYPSWQRRRLCDKKAFGLKYIGNVLHSLDETNSFIKGTGISKINFYKYIADTDLFKFVSWLSQPCSAKNLSMDEFFSKSSFDSEDFNEDFVATLSNLNENFWMFFFRYKDIRTLLDQPFYMSMANKVQKEIGLTFNSSSSSTSFHARYSGFELFFYPFILNAVNPSLVKDIVNSLIADDRAYYSNMGKCSFVSSFVFFNNDSVDSFIKQDKFKSANFDIRTLFYINIIKWGKINENFISLLQKEPSKNLNSDCAKVFEKSFPYINFDENMFILLTKTKANSLVISAAKLAPISIIPYFMKFREDSVLRVIQKRLESFDSQKEDV